MWRALKLQVLMWMSKQLQNLILKIELRNPIFTGSIHPQRTKGGSEHGRRQCSCPCCSHDVDSL